jgi:hypothetical protein
MDVVQLDQEFRPTDVTSRRGQLDLSHTLLPAVYPNSALDTPLFLLLNRS